MAAESVAPAALRVLQDAQLEQATHVQIEKALSRCYKLALLQKGLHLDRLTTSPDENLGLNAEFSAICVANKAGQSLAGSAASYIPPNAGVAQRLEHLVYTETVGDSNSSACTTSEILPYREIPLTRGYVALVSPEDYPWLIKFRWTALVLPSGGVYAVRFQTINGKRCCFYMHRQIMGEPEGLQVDHRDRKGLHNWRENLREATQRHNSANTIRKRRGVSGYKGVFPYGSNGKVRAMIAVAGEIIHLGCRVDKVEAARLYDAAAIRYNGPFAITNFLQPGLDNHYLFASPV